MENKDSVACRALHGPPEGSSEPLGEVVSSEAAITAQGHVPSWGDLRDTEETVPGPRARPWDASSRLTRLGSGQVRTRRHGRAKRELCSAVSLRSPPIIPSPFLPLFLKLLSPCTKFSKACRAPPIYRCSPDLESDPRKQKEWHLGTAEMVGTCVFQHLPWLGATKGPLP